MTMGASFRSTLVMNKRYVALSRYADSDAEEQLAKENVVLGDAYTAFDIESGWLAVIVGQALIRRESFTLRNCS